MLLLTFLFVFEINAMYDEMLCMMRLRKYFKLALVAENTWLMELIPHKNTHIVTNITVQT